jgi:hypothetical protein
MKTDQSVSWSMNVGKMVSDYWRQFGWDERTGKPPEGADPS